jgi:hypothetical protein
MNGGGKGSKDRGEVRKTKRGMTEQKRSRKDDGAKIQNFGNEEG